MKMAQDINIRKQGDLDGLCGIYSIVHFFLRYKNTDSDQVASRLFRLCLEGLEAGNSFSPERVKRGFGQGKLRKAFMHVAEKEKLEVTAIPLSKHAKTLGCDNVLEVLQAIAPDGAVMAHMQTPQHWVLGHSPKNKSFSIDDSAEGRVRQVRKNLILERKMFLKKGLVFLHAQKN